MRYDSILFDFDGVLADSEPVHYDCWKEILAEFGIDLDWDTYARECIGVADREMLARFCRQLNPPIELEVLIAQYPRKKQVFRERILAAPPFHTPTLELIRVLGDFKLAVVSSSGREEVEPPLVAVGVRDRFQAMVCGSEAKRLKPAPDAYLQAAKILGARNPLVIEDSDAGETAGRAAGFDVVRVRTAQEVPERVREALGWLR